MIRILLNLYILVIVVDIILSYLPQFKHKQWAISIRKAADFTCQPIRRILPPDLPVDVSGFIVIVGIRLIIGLW